MTYLLPLLLGLAHGASDAAAGLLVGLIIQQRSANMNTQILLYNLLAFGLQPLAGMRFDRAQSFSPRQGAVVSLAVTMCGLLVMPLNLSLAIYLIGLGSAGLHAGGGAVAIRSTPGKASGPGVFAAFGVIGLSLGGIGSINYAGALRWALVLVITALALLIWFASQPEQIFLETNHSLHIPVPLSILIVLIIAVTLRSTVWVGSQMEITRYSLAALSVALAAGTGKFVGGFAADRFGWQRWTLVALPGAGLLLVFSQAWLPAIMLGALLLQSITPLSIAAAGRSLPDSPALAASLTLGTAIIAGGLPFFFLAGGWFGAGVMGITLSLSAVLYWVAIKHPGLAVRHVTISPPK